MILRQSDTVTVLSKEVLLVESRSCINGDFTVSPIELRKYGTQGRVEDGSHLRGIIVTSGPPRIPFADRAIDSIEQLCDKT